MFRSVQKEQLKVPAKIDYLGELRDFVTKVGHRHGFSERVINAFKLSIDEAATNIIKHAYRDWSGSITIRAIVKKNSLTIVLIDQGKYFDPRQVNDPDLQRYVDIGKKGGLGIFIMRRLLDEIDYRKTEEGNELWLVKFRDVARKRRITVPSISMTLKARYWLISTAVFTFFLIGIYSFYYFHRDDTIIQNYLNRGRSALSVLASDVSTNLQQQLSEQVRTSMAEGTNSSEDIELLTPTQRAINYLQMAEYSDLLFNALIVDNNNIILSSTDSTQILERFTVGTEVKTLQKDVALYNLSKDIRVIDITYPVVDDKSRILCRAHFFINYEDVRHDISQARFSDLNLAGLVWLLGAAGLFLLIYLVMNPFRRLSEWVKELGQPGVADEMDIDTSTEIGEIAQAFSDITLKLRESQVNLAETERLQKEMQVAQEIQQTLLPSEVPVIEGYEIDAYYAAAKEVGGDYYDFVEVDKDTLGIVVADVSGKGVPGSLVMTMIRTALRTEARGIKDAAEVLSRVNDFVVNDMKKGMFVTLFYVIIDSKRRRINYASAGHNPLILYRASKAKTFYLNPHGFPIGISLPDKNLFRSTIESDTLSMAEDDILLIYTDGITEAMNRKRQLYGEERFLNIIREFGGLPAHEFVQKLHEELLSFTEGNPQSDDITLVAIKERSSAEKIELDRAKRVYLLLQQGKSIKDACESVGVSTYAYYSKYKEVFDKGGVDSYEVTPDTDSIEEKHLSIEEKTKLYDVIMRFPDYGAKKINETLNTERYSFLEINPSRIYDELVRAHLNTRELREGFVNRGGKKRRPKPPGTPMLTLDGRVIIQRGGLADSGTDDTKTVEPSMRGKPPRTKVFPVVKEIFKPRAEQTVPNERVNTGVEAGVNDDGDFKGRDVLSINTAELLDTPVTDLFDKRRLEKTADKDEHQEEEEHEPIERIRIDFEDQERFKSSLLPTDQKVIGDKELPLAPVNLETPHQSAPTLVDDSLLIRQDEIINLDEIDITPDKRLKEKTSEDELDFAAIIQAGEGLDDPTAHKEIQTLFKDFSAEEATVIDEFVTNSIHSKNENPDFAPFEEFLELDEEQGLINEVGELNSEIAEQILQNEIQERLGEVQPETVVPPESSWEVVQIENERDNGGQETEGEHRLNFEELLDILNLEKTSKSEDLGKSEGSRREPKKEKNKVDAPILPNDDKGLKRQLIEVRKRAMDEALQSVRAQEYEGAIAIYTEFLEKDSRDSEIRIMLAETYFRARRYREAAVEYERALHSNPESITAHERLGIIYASQGDFKKAVKQWEQLLRISPERRDISESIKRAKKFMSNT